MVFSELYSAYYHTVARILDRALRAPVTEKEMRAIIEENAFGESALTILPALKSGRWPLLRDDMTSVLGNSPTMPLTLMENRWLKAISEDVRVKLFPVRFPDLSDVTPLFTKEDVRIFDQYGDGDPYGDESYIAHFRLILTAIREHQPVWVEVRNRREEIVWVRFYPVGFEYSLKDDKIRVVADRCKYRYFNLGRVVRCGFFRGDAPWHQSPMRERERELVLSITDERNTLERAMLHFAHFEKEAERCEDGTYLLRLKYDAADETEMVIRVLSFGPTVMVREPASFVNLIRDRLVAQKSCEIR